MESFKERVRKIACEKAKEYKEFFCEKRYLIYSEKFTNKVYYIVAGNEENFLHLVGVNTALTPRQFFDKCIDGTLMEGDFDFIKKGIEENAVKGSVRRKIKALESMTKIFDSSSLVQENFKKNRIECVFASSDNICTVGFSNGDKSRPKTLLKGNELNLFMSYNLSVVLERNRGEIVFNKIFMGTTGKLRELTNKCDAVKELLSIDLVNSIE